MYLLNKQLETVTHGGLPLEGGGVSPSPSLRCEMCFLSLLAKGGDIAAGSLLSRGVLPFLLVGGMFCCAFDDAPLDDLSQGTTRLKKTACQLLDL